MTGCRRSNKRSSISNLRLLSDLFFTNRHFFSTQAVTFSSFEQHCVCSYTKVCQENPTFYIAALSSRMLSFVKGFSVVFLLSVITNNWANLSDYKELQDLGLSCYPRDSCQCSHYTTCAGEGKTCECESTCYKRGTCCLDSPYIDPHPSTRRETCSSELPGISRYYYFTSSGRYSFFQVAKCDRSWNGPLQIKKLCEMDKPVAGTDLMIAIPVTNTYSGTTYKNYFCALCNNDIEDAVLWDFNIVNYETSYSIVSDRFTIEATDEINDDPHKDTEGSGSCGDTNAFTLVFNEERAWGYWDYCANSSRFVPISVEVSIPDQIQHLVKACRTDVISSCPPDWTDVRVKVLCESYQGIINGPPRYSKYDVQYDQYFRNAHCALCNNVTSFEGYSCEQFLLIPILTPVYPISVTLLLAHTLSDKKCIDSNKEHIEGLGCRAIICSSQYKLKNGQCTRK